MENQRKLEAYEYVPGCCRAWGSGLKQLKLCDVSTSRKVLQGPENLETPNRTLNLIEPNCFMDVMNSVRTSLFEEPLHYAESDAFLVGSSCEKCGHDCECTTSRFFSTSLLFPKAWRALSELARISQMESPVD